VAGSGFDVDEFLKNSSLEIIKVFHEGKKPGPRRPVSETSGFNAEVSDRDFDDQEGQIDDALHFVKLHRSELEVLRSLTGVESDLDFAVETRDGKIVDGDEIVVWSIHFPTELLKTLGELEIGIEATIYPRSILDRIGVNSGSTE
jgi:hypothetical protein